MGFFSNMFGGGKKEEKPDPQLQAQINKERADLQRMQATESVDKSIQQFEAKIDVKNQEIAQLESVSELWYRSDPIASEGTYKGREKG